MRCWSILLLSICSLYANGQAKLALINEINVSFTIDQAAIDGLGNLYLSDKKGTLYKLDKSGQEIAKMASSNETIGSISADNAFKIFCFYPNSQQYTISNRFLANTQSYHIKDDIGHTSHATLGASNSIWLFDASNITLVKYNLLTKSIISESSLAQLLPNIPEITSIQQSNNHVFVAENNTGIYIFDDLGNYEYLVEERGIAQFASKGSNLIHLADDSTIHIHHIQSKQLQKIKIDPLKKYRQSLMDKNDVLLITEKTVDIYRIEE